MVASSHCRLQCDAECVTNVSPAGLAKISSFKAIDPAPRTLGKTGPIDGQLLTIGGESAHRFCRFAPPGDPGDRQQLGQFCVAHTRLTHYGRQAMLFNANDCFVGRFQLPSQASETERAVLYTYPSEMSVLKDWCAWERAALSPAQVVWNPSLSLGKSFSADGSLCSPKCSATSAAK